jgi:hypothetical protein
MFCNLGVRIQRPSQSMVGILYGARLFADSIDIPIDQSSQALRPGGSPQSTENSKKRKRADLEDVPQPSSSRQSFRMNSPGNDSAIEDCEDEGQDEHESVVLPETEEAESQQFTLEAESAVEESPLQSNDINTGREGLRRTGRARSARSHTPSLGQARSQIYTTSNSPDPYEPLSTSKLQKMLPKRRRLQIGRDDSVFDISKSSSLLSKNRNNGKSAARTRNTTRPTEVHSLVTGSDEEEEQEEREIWHASDGENNHEEQDSTFDIEPEKVIQRKEVQKFKEVDDWSLDYEEVPLGSSGLWE